MTRDELCERMSYAELIDRIANDELAAFDREHAQKEAEMKAKARG
jgi:hypothetical protein